MGDITIAAFCETGPYRHVAGLLRASPDAWFPWGYHRCSVAIDMDHAAKLHQRQVELWAIDDVRAPARAHCVAAGKIDFVVPTADYLALTLRCTRSPASQVDPLTVIERVREGFLLFEANRQTVGVGRHEEETAVPNSATLQEAVASLPLG